METEIREYLGRTWGWIVLRGVVAVLFGVFALARPGIALAALVLTWGTYAIADGIFALVAGWRVRDHGRPLWSLFISGALGIVAGALTFLAPGLTALALLLIIGAWAIGIGVMQIAAAIHIRRASDGDWALGLSGALSVIFGVLAIIHPGAGALGILWVIATYAMGFGVLLIVGGIRLKSYAGRGMAPA
jgi:uncharacterized membrane protein HdeD (DUF308 family)